MHPDHRKLRDVRYAAFELRADARQPMGTEWQRRERGLEKQPTRPELVDMPALHHAIPATHVLVEATPPPARGLDVQVRADPAADALPQEQLRGADRARGQ